MQTELERHRATSARLLAYATELESDNVALRQRVQELEAEKRTFAEQIRVLQLESLSQAELSERDLAALQARLDAFEAAARAEAEEQAADAQLRVAIEEELRSRSSSVPGSASAAYTPWVPRRLSLSGSAAGCSSGFSAGGTATYGYEPFGAAAAAVARRVSPLAAQPTFASPVLEAEEAEEAEPEVAALAEAPAHVAARAATPPAKAATPQEVRGTPASARARAAAALEGAAAMAEAAAAMEAGVQEESLDAAASMSSADEAISPIEIAALPRLRAWRHTRRGTVEGKVYGRPGYTLSSQIIPCSGSTMSLPELALSSPTSFPDLPRYKPGTLMETSAVVATATLAAAGAAGAGAGEAGAALPGNAYHPL